MKINLYELDGELFKVASLVADGHTNLEVGLKLGLPESTVKNRVASVLKFWGLKKRAQLVEGVWGPEGRPQRKPLEFKDGVVQLPVGARYESV